MEKPPALMTRGAQKGPDVVRVMPNTPCNLILLYQNILKNKMCCEIRAVQRRNGMMTDARNKRNMRNFQMFEHFCRRNLHPDACVFGIFRDKTAEFRSSEFLRHKLKRPLIPSNSSTAEAFCF
jgi:hypothetical protein